MNYEECINEVDGTPMLVLSMKKRSTGWNNLTKFRKELVEMLEGVELTFMGNTVTTFRTPYLHDANRTYIITWSEVEKLMREGTLTVHSYHDC